VVAEIPIVIPPEEDYDNTVTEDVISKLEKQYHCYGPDFVEAIER